MESIRRFRERHRTGWGVAAVLAGLLFLGGALFSFALGTCHDAGGFCSDSFGPVHIEAYATAAVLAGLGVSVAATAATLRVPMLLVAASVGALATAVLAVIGESLN